MKTMLNFNAEGLNLPKFLQNNFGRYTFARMVKAETPYWEFFLGEERHLAQGYVLLHIHFLVLLGFRVLALLPQGPSYLPRCPLSQVSLPLPQYPSASPHSVWSYITALSRRPFWEHVSIDGLPVDFRSSEPILGKPKMTGSERKQNYDISKDLKKLPSCSI